MGGMSNPECVCGCGGTTKGGQFLPGHDARHKANLFKAARDGDADALAEIDRRNWMHLYDKSVSKRDEPSTSRPSYRSRAALGLPDDGLPVKNCDRHDWSDLDNVSDEDIWDALTGCQVIVRRTLRGLEMPDEYIPVLRVSSVSEEGVIRFCELNGAARWIRAADVRATVPYTPTQAAIARGKYDE